MMQMVQAACPGCKNLLRIPADWIYQPMRCKHCGMVMQARQPAAPPPPANRTPPPATRPGHSASRHVKPAPAVAPALPAARPGASPFEDLAQIQEDVSVRRARRRPKSGGGWWKGPVIALCVLVVAAIVTVANWPRIVALLPPDKIVALLPPDEDAVAVNEPADKAREPVVEPPPETNEPRQTPPTAKTRPDKIKPAPTPRPTPRPTPPVNNSIQFPRRALIISVHDYLYANPVHDGLPGPNAHNLNTFIDQLCGVAQRGGTGKGLKIPMTQIAQLSDEAPPKWKPRAPTRTVIEQTLTNFLSSSRPQDRIMVFFIGHSVELGDEVYLAPIEGELNNADTLIPLKWFYTRMEKCKARQKVLVLDVNRFNPATGQERPGSGEMGPKLDALLQKPPAGVQVLSSCVAKQRSYENENSRIGVFLDAWYEVLRSGLSGRIQNPADPLPLERCVELINARMKKELAPYKLEQVCRLTGKEAGGGAGYDKNEPLPPLAMNALAAPPKASPESQAQIAKVLEQIGTPPIKPGLEVAEPRADLLPPFSEEALKPYQDDKPNPDSELRKAIQFARAKLWAIYPSGAPRNLASEVAKMRQEVKADLNVLRDGYNAPAGGNAEKQFKDRVEGDEKRVARIMRAMQDALDELEKPAVVEERGKESKRWQANYDFMLARIQLEYAFLFEYQSMLGSMRKELPPRDPNLHRGWKLAALPKPTGDSKGKSFATKGRNLLDKIAKEHKHTPWEVLAKRERLTNLGLEWQASP